MLQTYSKSISYTCNNLKGNHRLSKMVVVGELNHLNILTMENRIIDYEYRMISL